MTGSLLDISGKDIAALGDGDLRSLVARGALDPSLALYANLSDDPDPQPVGMVSDLIAGEAERSWSSIIARLTCTSASRRFAWRRPAPSV
jgi:hypothetical protein